MDEKPVIRNDKGQLEKGSAPLPGAGRPRKAVERAYLDAIAEIVTDAEWEKIVRKAVVDAKKGAPDARRWLSDYLVGKPPQILDLRAGDAQLMRDILEGMEALGYSKTDVLLAIRAQVIQDSEEDRDTESE